MPTRQLFRRLNHPYFQRIITPIHDLQARRPPFIPTAAKVPLPPPILSLILTITKTPADVSLSTPSGQLDPRTPSTPDRSRHGLLFSNICYHAHPVHIASKNHRGRTHTVNIQQNPPRILLTDKNKELFSANMKSTYETFSVHVFPTTSHQPQENNSINERLHSTIFNTARSTFRPAHIPTNYWDAVVIDTTFK